MPPLRHRMTLTQVDACRCALYNLRYELEHLYVVKPLSVEVDAVINAFHDAEDGIRQIITSLEILGKMEHPQGIPSTV